MHRLAPYARNYNAPGHGVHTVYSDFGDNILCGMFLSGLLTCFCSRVSSWSCIYLCALHQSTLFFYDALGLGRCVQGGIVAGSFKA